MQDDCFHSASPRNARLSFFLRFGNCQVHSIFCCIYKVIISNNHYMGYYQTLTMWCPILLFKKSLGHTVSALSSHIIAMYSFHVSSIENQ